MFVWDENPRIAYSGIDRVAVYGIDRPISRAWSGVKDITENLKNGSVIDFFDSGVKIGSSGYRYVYKATITAYTQPDGFYELSGYDKVFNGFVGSEQNSNKFNMTYRTAKVSGGYDLHLVYGAIASPSNGSWKTVTDNANLTEFVWDITATPIKSKNGLIAAHYVIDSNKVSSYLLEWLEYLLYDEGRMPSIDDLIEYEDEHNRITIVDNLDGTWTAFGSDQNINRVSATQFEILNANAEYSNSTTFKVASTKETIR